jgi:hypothetical protein
MQCNPFSVTHKEELKRQFKASLTTILAIKEISKQEEINGYVVI